MTWSSSLWWPCVMDLDMNPVIKSWFGQEEGGSSFLSGKRAGGSQRAEKDNSTNQRLSASPYHKPFADKQPHATSYQTCSFTFFPSTSMVFTLKSIPGRQQGGGGWGWGGKDCIKYPYWRQKLTHCSWYESPSLRWRHWTYTPLPPRVLPSTSRHKDQTYRPANCYRLLCFCFFPAGWTSWQTHRQCGAEEGVDCAKLCMPESQPFFWERRDGKRDRNEGGWTLCEPNERNEIWGRDGGEGQGRESTHIQQGEKKKKGERD